MNTIDLKNKVAVITGGAQGIGYATAERLLQSGATVHLWDIDADRLKQALPVLQALAQPGATVGGAVVELTDDAAVQQATQHAVVAHGRIDILVNNAGITGGNAPTWELDVKVWRQVIEVNLIAPYLTCRHVVPQMLRQGGGRIVNIASVAGKEGNPNASHYSASKAGLIALTKSLAKEVATKNIYVNAITPAVAKTAMFAQMKQEHIDYMLGKIPMGRFVQPSEIAAMVAWLCSDDCSFTTGSVFDITGGRSTY
jgi:2-dehydro-3-deoxy-L-rhamnonate dehydrogenase (NAD+)